MNTISSWLSDLSRRKLHVAASGRDGWRDTLNLRRFVLLKNSITQAQDPSPTTSDTEDATSNSFIFPTTMSPTEPSEQARTNTGVLESEDAWFASVLETLEVDDRTEGKVDMVDEEDFDFDDQFESWVSPFDEYAPDPLPFPFSSSDNFFASPSVLPPLQALLLSSPNSAFNQPFVEPRYPEADYDLPDSDSSSECESDDDDGPLTPYSGSEPSLGQRPAVEPEVYVEADSYFLYPSELDLISSPPFIQQC